MDWKERNALKLKIPISIHLHLSSLETIFVCDFTMVKVWKVYFVNHEMVEVADTAN